MRPATTIAKSVAAILISVALPAVLAVPVDDSKGTGRALSTRDSGWTEPKQVTYPPCADPASSQLSGEYTGCNLSDGPHVSLTRPKDEKRRVAYWSVFDSINNKTAEVFDPTLLDDLTHLVLFSINMTAFTEEPLSWTHSDWLFPQDIFKQARDKGVSVSVAFGGWGYDQAYQRMNSSLDGELAGNKIAKFALDNNLDGIDLDHEYPTHEQKDAWIAMIKTIKKNAPGKTLSVAVPAVPVYEPLQGAPREELVFDGYKVIFKEVIEHIDFINLMTYDMMNRYSQHRENNAFHHSYLQGFQNTIAAYVDMGVVKSKMNLGFANYAKWFTADQPCTKPRGINCTLTPNITEVNSGAFRYRYLMNFQSQDNTTGEGLHEWENKWASFNRTIGLETSAMNETTYDPEAMANSFLDTVSNIFWTWQSPYAVEQSCLKLKNSGIGGVMNFGLGQDTVDKVHHNALFKDCVGDWPKSKVDPVPVAI